MGFLGKLASLQKDLSVLKKHAAPVVWVSAATVTNNVLAFVVNVMAARTLGAEGFGVFSLAFSLATLVGTMGDLGLNLSMVRLYGKYQQESERQTGVLRSALLLKLALFLIVLGLSFPLGNALAKKMESGPESEILFSIALLTGGLLFLWSFLQSQLQAYQLFKQLAIFTMGYSVLRFICLLLAYSLFPTHPLSWLGATYTVPLVILVIVGFAYRGWGLLSIAAANPKDNFQLFKELLSYSKWVGLSSMAYTAMPYMARFILATRSSVADVGIFSAGMTFTMAFSTLNTAVRTVLFPKVVAMESSQIENYFGYLRRIMPYYAFLTALGVLLLAALQWFFLGEEYREALPVFLITAIASATVIFLGLATMLIHNIMKPELDAYTNLVRLMGTILLGYALASKLQALGMALAYSAIIVLGELYMLHYLRHTLRLSKANNGD